MCVLFEHLQEIRLIFRHSGYVFSGGACRIPAVLDIK